MSVPKLPRFCDRGLVTPSNRCNGVKRTSNDEVRSTVEHHAVPSVGARAESGSAESAGANLSFGKRLVYFYWVTIASFGFLSPTKTT